MMTTAPPFSLDVGQATRLLHYMQAYRRSALSHLPPTQERNKTLRQIQALQGTLLILSEQNLPHIHLTLTMEDVSGLKGMIRSLLLIYSAQPDSPERTTTITDLGKLYVYLKQTYS